MAQYEYTSQPLTLDGLKLFQKVIFTLIFYSSAFTSTLFVALNLLGEAQAKGIK